MKVQPLRRMKAVLSTLCIAGLLLATVVEGAVIVQRHFEVNFPGVDKWGNLDYCHEVISTQSVAFFNTKNNCAIMHATAACVPNKSCRAQVYVDCGNTVYPVPELNVLFQTNYGVYGVTKGGLAALYASGRIVPGNTVP
ncbi:MAG: hypothetical protein DWH81_06610 [Planctomycetota bacterium]|nr:MAG: hypothetical protein DWH81_06610 [Planctomycetota bacterium]